MYKLCSTKLNKINKEQAISEDLVLLDRVGLLDKKDAYSDQLSGGQKQRITRALAMKLKDILFYKPT